MLSGVDFASQGTFGNVWKHFGLSHLRCCYWPLGVETRDTTSCLTVYRTVSLQQKIILPKIAVVLRLRKDESEKAERIYKYVEVVLVVDYK